MQAATFPSALVSDSPPAPAPHTLRREVWPCLLLGLLTILLACVALWPLPLRAATHLVNLYDPLDSTWRIWQTNHNLFRDPLHFSSAPVGFPYHDTLFFDELILGEAVLATPLLWLTGNPVLCYNFILLLTFPLAAVGAYLLTYQWSRSRLAAAAAGLLYAFSAYHFMRVTQIGLANIGYLPLLLLAMDRLLRSRGRSRGWAAALAGLLVVQALSAQYYFFYMIILLSLYLAYALARKVSRPLFSGRFFVSLLLVGLAASLPVLPFYLQFLQVKDRWSFATDSDIALYSANFKTIFAAPASAPWLRDLLAPFFAGGWTDRERSLFPGFVPLLLLVVAVVGWLVNRRGQPLPLSADAAPAANPTGRYYLPFLLLLFFSSLVLSFGPYLQLDYQTQTAVPLPYWLLYQFVPGINGLHGVARIWVLGTLALSVLAGFGLKAILDYLLLRWRTGAPRVRLAASLPLALLTLALFEQIGPPYPTKIAPTLSDPPPYVSYLAAQPAGGLLNFPTMREKDSRSAYVNNIYQFYTIVHGKPVFNIPPNSVNPSGYRKLNADFRDGFLDRLEVDILYAVGVRYVAAQPGLMNKQQRASLQPNPALRWLIAYNGDEQPISEVASRDGQAAVIIYALEPSSDSLTSLAQRVPAGSSVYLSELDPKGHPAVLGAAAYVLANAGAQVYGYDYANFGVPVGAANRSRYDYTILYKDEPPPAASHLLWANQWLTLYQHD